MINTTGEETMHIKLIRLFILCLMVICTEGCKNDVGKQTMEYVNEGMSLFKSGDYDGAKLRFEKAIQIDPEFAEGYLYMAQCAVKKNNYKEGLELVKKALSLKKNNKNNEFTAFLLSAGQDANNKGDYEYSILFLQENVALNKNDSTAHLFLGKSLLERDKAGDLKVAISEFKTALGSSEDNTKNLAQVRAFLFQKANTDLQKNDMYKASRCYLAYTENFSQQDAEAYLNIGRLMYKMGNPVGALFYARKAYALDPKNKAVIELMDDLNSPMNG
jgi:tetratricopeptide (TPR) repeat protein